MKGWRVVFEFEADEYYFEFRYISDAGEFVETALESYQKTDSDLRIHIEPIIEKEEN